MTEVQKIILDIYKEVAGICDRNQIDYYAIGGTCLGAVRHQGFIPWDDDLDIAVPIEQYGKMIEVCRKELPGHYAVYIPGQTKHNALNFIKIMDKRTMMTESEYAPWADTYTGVWVDIMPLAGVPESIGAQKRFCKKVVAGKWLGYKWKSALAQQEHLSGKLAWLLCRPGYWLLPRSFVWDRWMKFFSRHPLKGSRLTGYVWSKNIHRLIFPAEWFSGYVDLPFEDTTMRCPAGWREFLTQMFGNYLEYPPEDKRNSGHNFADGCIDLQHSYLDYQTGKYKIEVTK